MVLSMSAFALEDMFVKEASQTLPVGEIMALFGLGGTFVFSLLTLGRHEPLYRSELLSRPIILRAVCEVTGRLCFILAIALTPLSSASAILQATPLVVVMGAALFFGEIVGWLRWTAVFAGFAGVLMILRPGLEGFEPASLFAVLGTLGFAGRDLATRAAPPVFSNMQLGVYGFFVLIPTGLAMVPFTGSLVRMDMTSGLEVMGAVFFGVIGYYSLTVAMRTGEVCVVTPFRYTRLIFALILGIIVFSERPDAMTLTGSLVIVLSGLYSLIKPAGAKGPEKNKNATASA